MSQPATDRPQISVAWSWAVAGMAGAGLLFTQAYYAFMGESLTGVFEEPTAYGYFYSLRILYGRGERPWMPHSHLVLLTYMGIHRLLAVLGFPATQLFPRVDIFNFLAAALPHLLTMGIFVWAIRPVQSSLGQLLMGLTLLYFSWGARAPGLWLAIPHYYPWVIPVSLLTAGWMLRSGQPDRHNGGRDWVWLGLFGGCCIAIKLSYLVFPLAVACSLLLNSRHNRRAFLSILGGLALSVLTYLSVLYAYYMGDVQAFLAHFPGSLLFFKSQKGTLPFQVPRSFLKWVVGIIFDFPPDPTTFGCLILGALFLTLLRPGGRAVTLSLLCGGCLSTLFLYERYYAWTVPEFNLYFFMALVVWSVAVLRPREPFGLVLARLPATLARALPTATKVALVTILLGLIYYSRISPIVSLLPTVAAYNRMQKMSHDFMRATPGRTLFIIPDDSRRFQTIDNAIYKGGTNIFSPVWGDSLFIKGMFSDREYLAAPHSTAVGRIEAFEKIAFVRPSTETQSEAIRKIEDVFGVTLGGFRCPFEAGGIVPTTIVVCRKGASPS